MRKGIKIKASVVLLAWLVIFAHGIIPHNHMQEGHEGCSVLIHDVALAVNDCGNSPVIEDQPEDAKICHFSNYLFKQHCEDTFVFASTREAKFYPEIPSGLQSILSSESYKTVPYFDESSLRAPPIV